LPNTPAVQTQTNATHPYYAGVPTQEEKNVLGRDAFLKILVAQLKYQDPLNPMDDRDFIAQTAQFSTLDQLISLNETIGFFTQFQYEQALSQHAHMIGKKVYWSYTTEDGTELSGEGMVSAVFFRNGELLAELDNGDEVPVWAIHRVENSPSASVETNSDNAQSNKADDTQSNEV